MQKVIKVKFRNGNRSYYFDAGSFELADGMSVVVNTTHGDMLGTVQGEIAEMDESRLSTPLKPVIRIASEDDLSQMEYYRAKEAEALVICREKIEKHGLAMKLVDAEYAFNGSKLTFYFTADNRVDFRELLKDLTSVFRSRIDLRQIGDRDEAKKCGGLGFCGRPVCCSTFLSEFTPVSIKMAKTQNLSLNPLKISGICGKLMCCLRYEQDAYESMQKVMPRTGKEFNTPDGPGIVLENNVITETTKLKITLPDGTFDVRSYPFRELSALDACEHDCSACGGCCAMQASGENPENEPSAERTESALVTIENAEKSEGSTHNQGKKPMSAHLRRQIKGGAAQSRREGNGSSDNGGSGNAHQGKKPHRRFNSQQQRRRGFSHGAQGENDAPPENNNAE